MIGILRFLRWKENSVSPPGQLLCLGLGYCPWSKVPVAPWLFCLGVSWICLYCAMNCNNRMHLGLLIGYQRIRPLSASLHYTVCLEILLFWRLSWLTPRWQRDGSLFLSTMHLPLKLIESNRTLFPFLVDILSPYEIRFSELNPEWAGVVVVAIFCIVVESCLTRGTSSLRMVVVLLWDWLP